MLSNRIRALREEKGLRQEDLAGLLSVSASAVGMYEQGRREPGVEALVAMAGIFGVSLDYLLLGRESVQPRREPELCPCESCYWSPRRTP